MYIDFNVLGRDLVRNLVIKVIQTGANKIVEVFDYVVDYVLIFCLVEKNLDDLIIC